jgi:hypothetical protein
VKDKKIGHPVIFLIGILLLVLGVVSITQVIPTYTNAEKLRNEATTAFAETHLPIISARFDSPKIFIATDSVTEFLQKAQDINATVIYQDYYRSVGGGTYVVVDSNFVYAYDFNLPDPLSEAFGWIMGVTVGFMFGVFAVWVGIQEDN